MDQCVNLIIMTALEVRINDEPAFIAGTDDLCVLSGIVNAVGKLGNRTRKPHNVVTQNLMLHVGGLTCRGGKSQDYHVAWRDVSLQLGDRIEFRIVETETADRPRSRRKKHGPSDAPPAP